MLLICVHSYNYVLRIYFNAMLFVFVMILLLVEMFGNAFVKLLEHQRILP